MPDGLRSGRVDPKGVLTAKELTMDSTALPLPYLAR
jgi:hypothetical protein